MRARSQVGLLAAAAVLVVLAVTLAGTCAHLLTSGRDRALVASLAGVGPADAAARARFDLPAGLDGATQQTALDAASDALRSSADPAPAAAWTGWSTSARFVVTGDGDPRSLAHLGSFASSGDGDVDDVGAAAPSPLAEHASLLQGRWPEPSPTRGPLEAVAPAGVDGAVAPGSLVTLAAAPADETTGPSVPLQVLVVGTYTADRSDPVWQLDPLRGAGAAGATDVPGTGGRRQLPSTGPLLVDPSALEGSGAGAAVIAAEGGAVVVPRLTGLTAATARALTTPRTSPLSAVEAAVASAAGAPAESLSVTTGLPGLLSAAAAHLATARAGVLVAAVVGAAAALTALAAAAQLLAERRRGESALLALRGAGARQRLALEAQEASAVVLLSLLVALPLSASVGGVLLAAVLPSAADGSGGGSGGPLPLAPPSVLLAAGAVGVFALLVAVLPHLREVRHPGRGGRPGRSPRRGGLARSGVDVLAVALTVVAWWQLRSSSGSSSGAAGPGGSSGVEVLVPALALVAGSLLGLRALGLLRRGAERLGRGTPRAVPAVVGWSLARSPLAAAAAALVVLAAGTGVTALAWRATWSASQEQQVTARLGADLTAAVDGDGDGDAGDGTAALEQASVLAGAGASPSPVLREPVSLGTRVGAASGAAQPVLVARPSGPSSALRSGDALTGPLLPARPGPVRVVLTASTAAASGPGAVPTSLRVQPSLVVRDGWGVTAVLAGPVAAADGAPHDLDVAAPDLTTAPATTDAGGLRLVGVVLRVLPGAEDPASGDGDDGGAIAPTPQVRLDVALAVPGAQPTPGRPSSSSWTTGTDLPGVLESLQAAPATGGEGVTAAAVVHTDALPDLGGVLRAQASPPPDALPVEVSRELADQLGTGPGAALEVGVGAVAVTARVVGVVGVVPTAPGAPALLADADALSRTLLAAGAVPRVDRWWVGGGAAARQRAAAAVDAASGAGFAGVVDRAEQVDAARTDPLTAGLRAAWQLLLAASGAAALAGSALLTAAASADDRALAERLRVLGVRGRDRAAAVLLPRALQLGLGLLVGVVVGLVVTAAVVPVLVRAPDGSAPVPRPDAAEALRLAVGATSSPLPPAVLLVVLAAAVALPLAVAAVRLASRGTSVARSRARVGEAP